jgi:hypothetical protein
MQLSDLPEKVLAEMGVLATGESPNVADAAVVSDKYTALYEMLITDGMVAWAAADDIPPFAEQPIVWMLANLCASKFAVPQARRAELEQLGALNLQANKGGPSLAETQLRRQLAKGFVYYPMSTDYF